MTLSINDADESLLEKRFKLLTQKPKYVKLFRILILTLGLSIYLYSYLFMFEAYVTATEWNNEPVFTLTADNTFILAKEDGTYDIYLYGSYLETVNSLEYYSDSIPIYNTLEDAYEH